MRSRDQDGSHTRGDASTYGPGRTLGAPATSGPSSASARVAAPLPPPSSAPLVALSLDARFVNDNQNEVGSADIVDGSLTGADVSTTSGNVTIGGGTTVIAAKGVFGFGANASTSTSTVSGGRPKKDPVSDPAGSSDRVTRGGGFGSPASNARSAPRDSDSPSGADHYRGARPAKGITP